MRIKQILAIIICFSFVLAGCSKNKDVIIETTSSDSVITEPTVIEPAISEEERSDTIAKLISLDSFIDRDYAVWLFENYTDESMEIAASSDYNGKIWHEKTGNSLQTLKTLMVGIENSPKTFIVEGSNADDVLLAFAGDTSFAPDYAPAQLYINGGIDVAFSKELQSTMQNADVFLLNNEFCYSDRGEPLADKSYTFRADPATANWLKEMGVDIVSLANNHAFDYGEEAFLDTLSTLENINMPYTGGGHDIEDAAAPTYIISNGIKIAYVAATEIEASMATPHSKSATEDSAGLFRTENLEMVLDSIKEAKENSDFVIAIGHWGREREQETQYDEQFLAHSFVEAGADAVIGGHPHVLQGVEYYNDTPIFYSLGNFFFNNRVIESCVVYLTVNIDGLYSARFIPCVENGNGTVQCEPDDPYYSKIIDQINRYSAEGVSIGNDGLVNY